MPAEFLIKIKTYAYIYIYVYIHLLPDFCRPAENIPKKIGRVIAKNMISMFSGTPVCIYIFNYL